MREILEGRSLMVRNQICHLLQGETMRSFQNVAQQIKALQEMVEEIGKIMDFEEARALGHLMRDIHPSNIQALQIEADGMGRETAKLRSALQEGNFENLRSQACRSARLIAQKAKRFRDKYAEFRPKLEKMLTELVKICTRCAAEEQKSENLIAETE